MQGQAGAEPLAPDPRREPQSARFEVVTVIDCQDLARSAKFWAEVLGYRLTGISDRYATLEAERADGPEVLLQCVSEPKVGKNRVHLDLRTADLSSEVNRVLGLGALLLTPKPVSEDGWTWQALADLDGNEFCVLSPTPG